MNDITFTVSSSDMIELVLVAAGMIYTYATLNARVKQMESHADKIDQIAPLQTGFAAFRDSINTEIKNLRDDVRDLAASVRDLANLKARG